MLDAGSVVSAIDESFCVADDPVQPLEHLTVRIEHLILVSVSFRQRLTVAFISVRLNSVTGSNALRDKLTHCLLLYQIWYNVGYPDFCVIPTFQKSPTVPAVLGRKVGITFCPLMGKKPVFLKKSV